jgi:hypothetical protein
MISTAQSFIDAAKVLVDDDHQETSGWMKDSSWIQFLNWEYQALYRRLLRASIIQVAPVTTPFTGTNVTVTNAIAIIGVAQDMGNYARVLQPFNGANGPSSKFLGSNEATSPTGQTASVWQAVGSSEGVYVNVYPFISANYILKHIPAPTYVVANTDTIDIPIGHERRLVYGMARHAMIKDVSRSALLDRYIQEADEEIGMASASRSLLDSPRVRRVQPRLTAGVDMYGKFPSDPNTWFYP